ncbi:MAG: 50S ribosomal protein L19 [Clostridia bacterium]|nr:50S ribosomal protein L19 [Clostridia bacterium]
MDIIKAIEHEQLKSKVPVLDVGNTVKVHVKVKEGNRERIQVFEGIIIKKQGGGVNETFTVRKISYGVGVEKTFLLHSPNVEKVEVVRVGKARRAKLFYLRDRLGKSARTKEKVGARIETKEQLIKEELEEVPVEEAVVENTEAVVETVQEEVANVEEAKVEETTVEEVKEEVKEEVPAEVAPEEAPAVETEAPAVEETVDTVSEEPVEEVKDVTEENKEEE